MMTVDRGASPYAYLDALFFFDTVANGARTGTANASNAQFDFHRFEGSIGGYVPLDIYSALDGPGVIVEVKVIINVAFNGTGQTLVLGRGGNSAQIQAFGTDALILPAVRGVKDMTGALVTADTILTANLLPKARLTYTAAPTAGEGRVIFTVAS